MPEKPGATIGGIYTAQVDDLDECCADCKRWGDQWQMGPDNVPALACPACGIQKIREAYSRKERA